jgi:MFS family permease
MAGAEKNVLDHLRSESKDARPSTRDNHRDTVRAIEAKHGSDAEQTMSLFQAIKLYPKAIGWSVLLSSTLIMEGYDLALLGNLYPSAPFNEKYGTFDAARNKYSISAAWQSGLSNGARAGEIIGLLLVGWTSDRFGYKMSIIGSLILMKLAIFCLFFAPNIQILVLGEVLCGMHSLQYKLNGSLLTRNFQVSRGEPFRALPQRTPLRLHQCIYGHTLRFIVISAGLSDSSSPSQLPKVPLGGQMSGRIRFHLVYV